jgi:ribosomal protein S18 acetylase RimI-like enzyme
MQVYLKESDGSRLRIDMHESDAYISDVFVPIELRGQGLGRALVEQAVAVCHTLGIRTIVMHVSADNTPMVHISENLAFSAKGTEIHYEYTA